ncbi:MAG TPA: hypothetical protein VER17_12810, partial [Tepidisphaeraceae bacterium]|nr:hypothetical protein [Tepidisphaeraceae bacterium]
MNETRISIHPSSFILHPSSLSVLICAPSVAKFAPVFIARCVTGRAATAVPRAEVTGAVAQID